MSFLSPASPADLASDPQSQPYKLQGAVPVVHGTQWVSVTLLEDANWNLTENDDGDTRPKRYWRSVAGMLCQGPVKKILAMRVNGSDPYTLNLTLNQNGTATTFNSLSWWGDFGISGRFYAGTPTQNADPRLTGTSLNGRSARGGGFRAWAAPNTHPPYSGLCYVVLDYFSFDFFYDKNATGDTTAGKSTGTRWGDLEFLVYVEPQGLTTTTSSERHGCNPIAIAYDWLTNPRYGQGLPDSIVPAAEWQAAVDRMESEGYAREDGSTGNLSTVLAGRADLEKQLEELFFYFDGFLKLRNGQLLPDWHLNAGPIDGSELHEITEHDLLEPAEVERGSWDDTVSEVVVNFTDYDADLGEGSVAVRSPFNVQITGEPKSKTFDAPWIHDRGQAARFAARLLARLSVPELSGTFKPRRAALKREDGTWLGEGDLFHFDYEPHELDVTARIVDITDENGEITVEWMVEPGQWPEMYVATEDERLLPIPEAPGEVTNWRLFELPFELRQGMLWPAPVLVLVERPNSSVTRCGVWISGTDDWAGEESQLPDLTRFSTVGELIDPIADDDDQVFFTTGNGSMDNWLGESLSDGDQLNGETLLLVGDELMILKTLEFSDEGQRSYKVVRGAYGTISAGYSAEEPVWIFRREIFDSAYRHALTAREGSIHIKIVPMSLFEEGTMSESKELELSYSEPNVTLSPAISDGVYTGGWHRGQYFPFEAEVTGYIRRVTTAIYYNDQSNDAAPSSGDFDFQVAVVHSVDLDGSFQTINVAEAISLHRDTGWNAIGVHIEDIRGPAYSSWHGAWLWVYPALVPSGVSRSRSGNDLTYTWSSVTGISNFEVLHTVTAVTDPLIAAAGYLMRSRTDIHAVSSAAFALPDAPAPATNRIVVRSVFPNGAKSEWSNENSFATYINSQPQPTDVTSNTVSGGTRTVKMRPVGAVTPVVPIERFILLRKNPGGDWEEVHSVPALILPGGSYAVSQDLEYSAPAGSGDKVQFKIHPITHGGKAGYPTLGLTPIEFTEIEF